VLIKGFSLYYLQLLAILFGAGETARQLLEEASREVLRGLGVRVLMDRIQEPLGRPQIHIANHGHPLDVLLIQGYFCQCSMTTAARHLRWLLPFFAISASHYGHINLDHLSAQSRLDGLRRLLALMASRGRIFLFPSGSLVTPITERVSGSLSVLSRRSAALIVPWFLIYRGFPRSEQSSRYKPLQLILRRLFGPEATILCQQGALIDPGSFPDQAALSAHIRDLYASRELPVESIPGG
jgi:hypothetical protein